MSTVVVVVLSLGVSVISYVVLLVCVFGVWLKSNPCWVVWGVWGGGEGGRVCQYLPCSLSALSVGVSVFRDSKHSFGHPSTPQTFILKCGRSGS